MPVRTFEDLDDATRVNAIMELPVDERNAVMVALLLETHKDVKDLKRERRWLYGAGHLVTAIVAGAVGIFGQPLRP